MMIYNAFFYRDQIEVDRDWKKLLTLFCFCGFFLNFILFIVLYFTLVRLWFTLLSRDRVGETIYEIMKSQWNKKLSCMEWIIEVNEDRHIKNYEKLSDWN